MTWHSECCSLGGQILNQKVTAVWLSAIAQAETNPIVTFVSILKKYQSTNKMENGDRFFFITGGELWAL
jgi:hypothetical protein